MKLGQQFRKEFNELQTKKKELRLDILMNISNLVLSNGGTLTSAIAIKDGPKQISAWDDEVDAVVVGVTATHIIIDEAGSESAVLFKEVSTETLLDTFCSLEKGIKEGNLQIDDYSKEVSS